MYDNKHPGLRNKNVRTYIVCVIISTESNYYKRIQNIQIEI